MPHDADPASAMSAERAVWRGAPSQWQNLGWWLSCLLVVGIPFALWRWLVVRTTRYVLTDQRLQSVHGVFSRVTDDLELYRVKDTRCTQSFWQRIVGIGDIELSTSDATTPLVRIAHLKDAERIRDLVRSLVEQRRDAKRVREVDFAHEAP